MSGSLLVRCQPQHHWHSYTRSATCASLIRAFLAVTAPFLSYMTFSLQYLIGCIVVVASAYNNASAISIPYRQCMESHLVFDLSGYFVCVYLFPSFLRNRCIKTFSELVLSCLRKFRMFTIARTMFRGISPHWCVVMVYVIHSSVFRVPIAHPVLPASPCLNVHHIDVTDRIHENSWWLLIVW